MSQNQSYFWQTTRHNVYLKRSARLHMLLALLAVMTFSTICAAEINGKEFNDENGVNMGAPTFQKLSADEQNIDKNDVANAANGANDIPNVDATTKESSSQTGFVDAFTASISVILFTELGDKTFFIAAIMAMRHPRLIVFIGAIGALALMTVLSVVFGMAATIIPKVYTYYISTALFAIFGLKMIYEGYFMKATDAQEEFEEVQSDLRKRDDELLRSKRGKYDDSDAKRKNSNSDKEDNAGSVERGAGAGATAATNALPTVKNPEMQHRQRKQPAYNSSRTANGGDLNTGANDDDYSSNECGESDVFLHGGGDVLKMSTFQSSPALSMGDSSNKTDQSTCDEFNSSPAAKLNHKARNSVDGNDRFQSNSKHPMVHSSSATAALMNKNGHAVMSTSNHSINSISSLSLNSTAAAGQSAGELKQVSGSKKRVRANHNQNQVPSLCKYEIKATRTFIFSSLLTHL